VKWCHLILAGFLLLAGCSFNPEVSSTDHCVVDDDCRPGRFCVDGRCSDQAALADAGEADGGEMREDASRPGCEVDRDGDGWLFGPDCSADELDCDDNDDAIFPGAPTACNGKDNDCDGEIDREGCECTDGFAATCGTDVGVCERGTRTCEDGRWGPCLGGTQPEAESCNGFDDDCDGTIDESCPCTPGETQECGLSEGACETGTQSCDNGMWSDCQGGIGPVDETCNGADDDCDGVTDNDTIDGGAPCDTGEAGRCGPGAETCRNGDFACVSIAEARAETCNAEDDDCDGDVDEGVTRSCSSACGPGTETCADGMFGACLPDNPPPESCNGNDDDCDGDVDETFPEDGMTCDTGEPGRCAAGAWACGPGGLVCERTQGPVMETCDGEDNDCDGYVDEDDDGRVLAEECGGGCPDGSVRLCLGGDWSACEYGHVEICNGSDSNCDGADDNLATCYQRCPGGDYAVGTLDCSTGFCSVPLEICDDGIDNDCDGQVDNGCDSSFDDMVYVPGGTFLMGSRQNAPYTADDETPMHVVELDPYYIDRFEVRRSEYGDCVVNGACSVLRVGCPLQLTQQDKPAVCVTWEQAQDYCQWKGKRLPTEAEWEKAARGPFPREVLWPWGDAEDSSLGVFDCDGNANQCSEPTDSFSAGASYFGLHHMAGNAAEWVRDYYDPDFYSSSYVVAPENTTPSNDGRVVRGGGYGQTIEFGRVANRAIDDFVENDEIGFRCAR
jgi:formylglycine-generating enzyme required for sulfatase activity